MCRDQDKFKQVVLGAVKIVSYITVIIPLIMLVAKAVFRATHEFHAVSMATKRVDSSIPPQQLSASEEKKEASKSSASMEPDFALSFYENVDQATFWDYYLKSYYRAVVNPKWDSIQGLRFLGGEFEGIKKSLEELLVNLNNMHGQCQEVIKAGSSGKARNYISESIEFVFGLLDRIDGSVKTLKKKISNQDGPKLGFNNVGNTCYINSALQPLLAVENFLELVPDSPARQPEHDFDKR